MSRHKTVIPYEDIHFLTALWNSVTEAVLATDFETSRIVYWNTGAETLFGYSAQEVLGRSLYFLYPDSSAVRRVRERGVSSIQEHGYWHTEAAYRRHDGSQFLAEATWTCFLRPSTEEIHLTSVIRPFQQEQQGGQQHLATLGAATAQLAHEIGNPLNGMHTTVQILERHLAKRQDRADDLLMSSVQDLGREIYRLWSLLRDLRSLARPPSLTLQPTDLPATVAEVLTVEAFRYHEGGIVVEQDFPADLPFVKGDRAKLEQVILNLCKNAVEAMPQGGTLTVRAFPSGEQVSFEISDTGVGIPEGLEVFELFTTTKPEGTGFGLAVVQQIVSAHGGTITYTSTPGRGTTFILTLPVSTAPPERV